MSEVAGRDKMYEDLRLQERSNFGLAKGGAGGKDFGYRTNGLHVLHDMVRT